MQGDVDTRRAQYCSWALVRVVTTVRECLSEGGEGGGAGSSRCNYRNQGIAKAAYVTCSVMLQLVKRDENFSPRTRLFACACTSVPSALLGSSCCFDVTNSMEHSPSLKVDSRFSGTCRFITVSTRIRRRSLSSHLVSLRSSLILSSLLRLNLPSDLFPSGFSD